MSFLHTSDPNIINVDISKHLSFFQNDYEQIHLSLKSKIENLMALAKISEDKLQQNMNNQQQNFQIIISHQEQDFQIKFSCQEQEIKSLKEQLRVAQNRIDELEQNLKENEELTIKKLKNQDSFHRTKITILEEQTSYERDQQTHHIRLQNEKIDNLQKIIEDNEKRYLDNLENQSNFNVKKMNLQDEQHSNEINKLQNEKIIMKEQINHLMLKLDDFNNQITEKNLQIEQINQNNQKEKEQMIIDQNQIILNIKNQNQNELNEINHRNKIEMEEYKDKNKKHHVELATKMMSVHEHTVENLKMQIQNKQNEINSIQDRYNQLKRENTEANEQLLKKNIQSNQQQINSIVTNQHIASNFNYQMRTFETDKKQEQPTIQKYNFYNQIQ